MVNRPLCSVAGRPVNRAIDSRALSLLPVRANERRMLTLYSVPGAWGAPSLSPFCTKLETWLRMTGLAFEARATGPRAVSCDWPCASPG